MRYKGILASLNCQTVIQDKPGNVDWTRVSRSLVYGQHTGMIVFAANTQPQKRREIGVSRAVLGW